MVSAVLINWGELHGMSNTETLIEIFPSFVGPSFCCVFLFFQSNERRFDWRFWIILGCDLLGMVLLTTSISLAGIPLECVFGCHPWMGSAVTLREGPADLQEADQNEHDAAREGA